MDGECISFEEFQKKAKEMKYELSICHGYIESTNEIIAEMQKDFNIDNNNGNEKRKWWQFNGRK